MSLIGKISAMPTLGCALPHLGFVRYREARASAGGLPTVVLHGIGSGSASWIEQLCDDQLGRILAWDAPGYADSTPLKADMPSSRDYGNTLWAWLDELQIDAVHLVGHSLGCIMAAGASRLQPARVKALTLLAPAQGYGTAPPAKRDKVRDERLSAMSQLGLQKMAESRAPRLLSADASKDQLALAILMMSQLNEGGYTQATHMLTQADIRADLAAFRLESSAPVQVACGDQDIITPPAACRDLAAFIQAPYTELEGAGHLCALQAPQALSQLLQQQGRAHG